MMDHFNVKELRIINYGRKLWRMTFSECPSSKAFDHACHPLWVNFMGLTYSNLNNLWLIYSHWISHRWPLPSFKMVDFLPLRRLSFKLFRICDIAAFHKSWFAHLSSLRFINKFCLFLLPEVFVKFDTTYGLDERRMMSWRWANATR